MLLTDSSTISKLIQTRHAFQFTFIIYNTLLTYEIVRPYRVISILIDLDRLLISSIGTIVNLKTADYSHDDLYIGHL